MLGSAFVHRRDALSSDYIGHALDVQKLGLCVSKQVHKHLYQYINIDGEPDCLIAASFDTRTRMLGLVLSISGQYARKVLAVSLQLLLPKECPEQPCLFMHYLYPGYTLRFPGRLNPVVMFRA